MKFILSIDGGGVNGIIPAAILCNLYRAGLKTPDLIAGTSTGGLIALALALGYQPEDILRVYLERGKEIFQSRWWTWGLLDEKYGVSGLESILHELFNGETLDKCSTKAMVTAYSLLENRPRVFRSWIDSSVQAVYAARATSAAPTYFEPQDGLVDGGVAANNPSLLANDEAENLWPGEERTVLSLGCGDTHNYIDTDDVGGALKWARSIIGLFMDANAKIVHRHMKSRRGVNYIRISPSLGKLNSAMDNTEGNHIKLLERIGRTADIETALCLCK